MNAPPFTIFKRFSTHWILLILLIVFVILKYPHLSYAFYWDESWPYASGVNMMYQHGSSLLPGSITGHVSRGHPLFFHFMAAVWMNVFGSSHFAMHCFPLVISILFLAAIYIAGLKIGGNRQAILSVAVIVFQQIYFVQASMLLLEILLGMLVFVSIYFYVNRKYIALTISLAMLYYTKESGMILGIILGIDTLLLLFSKRGSNIEKIKLVAATAFPVVLIALFFVMQKQVNGWYVLPVYTNGFSKEWFPIYSGIQECLKILFVYDCRNYVYALPLLMSIAVAIKKKEWKYAILIIPALTALLMINVAAISVASYFLTMVFIAGYIYTAVFYSERLAAVFNVHKSYFVLSFAFVLCFLIFSSSILSVIVRYLLPALGVSLFICSLFIGYFLNCLNLNKYTLSVIVVLFCIEAYGYKKYYNLGDCSLGAFDGMYVEEEAMKYMDSHNYYDSCVAIYGYMQARHLSDSTTGFRKTSRPYTNIKWGTGECSDVVMLENIEFEPALDSSRRISNDSNYILVHRAAKGEAWSEIYTRK